MTNKTRERSNFRSERPIPMSLLIAAIFTQLLVVIEVPTCEASRISEFTLDELTSADQNYQPIGGFGSPTHLGPKLYSNPGFVGDGQAPNRLRVLEQALARQLNTKRAGERKSCHPTKPFLCPSDEPQGGECIPIQYLCDGAFDCPATGNSPGGYDEDPLLCTAAKRPPVEDTANFLRTLLNNHGAQYIEKLFGEKISQALVQAGGPERVAIALSVSKTIEDFGKALHLKRNEIDHLRNVLVAVQTTDGPMLEKLGIVKTTELFDMKFFLEKLKNTGFLD